MQRIASTARVGLFARFWAVVKIDVADQLKREHQFGFSWTSQKFGLFLSGVDHHLDGHILLTAGYSMLIKGPQAAEGT